MVEGAPKSTAAGPEPHAREPQPQLRNHRVVRSEDLPRFSIGTPVAVGIIIWVVLLGAALLMHDRLAQDGKTWWIWSCVVGIVLGLLGWLYITLWISDQPGQTVQPDQPDRPDSP